MAKTGQGLEKLVEALEKMDMEGADIRTRDKIYDRVAKESREVDISVRFRKGSHEFLIIFECRDRKRKNGPDWIEQITQKTKDLGANKVIAVSSSGFSRGAIEKAKHNNILLRTLEEITQQEIYDWFLPKSFPVRKPYFSVKQLRFIEKEFNPENPVKLANYLQRFGEDQIKNLKFILLNQELGSINDLFLLVKWDAYFKDIPDSGDKVLRQFNISSEKQDGFQLMIENEKILIDHFELIAEMWIETTRTGIQSIQAYKIDGKIRAQLITFGDINFLGGKGAIEMLLVPSDRGNQISLRLVKSDIDGGDCNC